MPKLFNQATDKQGLLVFNGEASRDYGIVVAEAPTFERPVRKQQVFTVPGRNGAVVFQQDAWEDVPRVYKVWLAQSGVLPLNQSVDAFMGWLNSSTGYQRLEDSFEPEVFRLGYYSGGNDFTNEMTQYGESELTFTCRPERFYKSGEEAITVTDGLQWINPTRFTAKPLIKIEVASSTTIAFTIEGVGFTVQVADYIYIDCEKMNAYRLPTENKNDKVSGDFPVLIPGQNTFHVTGTVSKVTVTPRTYTI